MCLSCTLRECHIGWKPQSLNVDQMHHAIMKKAGIVDHFEGGSYVDISTIQLVTASDVTCHRGPPYRPLEDNTAYNPFQLVLLPQLLYSVGPTQQIDKRPAIPQLNVAHFIGFEYGKELEAIFFLGSCWP